MTWPMDAGLHATPGPQPATETGEILTPLNPYLYGFNPYVGKDWSPMTANSIKVMSIDFTPYIPVGDQLLLDTLTASLTIAQSGVAVSQYIPVAAYMVGNIANQSVVKPAAGSYYKLSFICNTFEGNKIELYSNFTSQ